jgi:hypothetical protein
MPTNTVWTDGGVPQILFANVKAHILSYADETTVYSAEDERSPHQQQRWMTSWCGFAATTHLYTHSVLGLLYAEQPSLGRLSRRLLLILERDVTGSEDMMRTATETARDFWLWKVFVGAFYLAAMVRAGWLDGSDAVLAGVRASLNRCLRTWSDVVGASGWGDAREVLERVVWPTTYVRPGVAKAVWEDALKA